MAISQQFLANNNYQPDNDQLWCELYATLRPYILSRVYSSGVSSWQGQEQDVTEDILQETLIRMFTYTQKSDQGKGKQIHSELCFGRTVAQHHLSDLRRREQRFIRPSLFAKNSEHHFFEEDVIDPSEVALSEISRISRLQLFTDIIASFPEKQRNAMLTDLAQLDEIDEHRPLYSAFLAIGIDLDDYRSPRPDSPLERSRYSASLCTAYRRFKQEILLQDQNLLTD